MASDDRQSEQFIREVDEELRRAQMKAIWDRFAPLIIGVCILVVLLTAGYRGWLWWQGRQAAQEGDRFMAALEAIEGGEREEGVAALQAIAAEGGGGYPVLAQLRLAGVQAGAGESADAIATYDSVAADDDAPQSMRDVAQIRAALLALDAGDLEGAASRAERLNVAGNPWRHAAREILGTAAYQSGELEEGRDAFLAIQQDAETPPDLWLRAGMMVQLIDGQMAAPETLAPETTTAEEGAAAPTAPAPAQNEPAGPPTTGAAPEPAALGSETPAGAGSEQPLEAGAQPAVQAAPASTAAPVAPAPALAETSDDAAPAAAEPATPSAPVPETSAPPVPASEPAPQSVRPTSPDPETAPPAAPAQEPVTPAPPGPATAAPEASAPAFGPEPAEPAPAAPPAPASDATAPVPQTVIPPQ